MTDARARDDILELATRAKQAVHSPSSFMTELLVQQQQYACLNWLCRFDVLRRIPLPPSSVSYRDLARACDVPEDSLRAATRMVMTTGFLRETASGEAAHNALSAAFVENADLMTWMLHMVNHTVPFMNGFAAATEKFGDSLQTNETAFNVAFDTDLAYFPYLKSRPDLEREFDAYMQSQSKVHGGARVEHLLDGFDWAALPEDALVVDVGGGSGSTSLAVAREFEGLRFVVQDQATPIEGARRRKAAAAAEDPAWQRIELQEHDFFGPQPVAGAAVYLLRMIIHDWPDAKAAQILGQLARAMSPASRLLIMDMVIPAPGSGPILAEAALREKDLCMRQVFNAKERETGDWHSLVAQVDPPLRIRAIKRPDGCQHSVIEVALARDGHAGATNGVNKLNGTNGTNGTNGASH
ncbi:S-adenosyl-L-methionine-dependent methyltransferase [Durotheca rogersii]|uniref:S-adenosyl-L-methionine-dependent methyltransferase n=1 Tax=Durotheca rogersii TaxID=419775 RepID=UPI00221EC869|nr:S-adenosyl-L-methionine-dependent methyltransferase [Durotheca rogersii]KAI5855065.1 S-adenosyl-L-methionine-dependent methyltransferase [Durotheca rogersii]